MVKFPGISGPSKSSEPLPPSKNAIPGPEDYKLPEHMGEKTQGVRINGALKTFQALDRHGVMDKTTPELTSKMGEAAILALGEIVKKQIPN